MLWGVSVPWVFFCAVLTVSVCSKTCLNVGKASNYGISLCHQETWYIMAMCACCVVFQSFVQLFWVLSDQSECHGGIAWCCRFSLFFSIYKVWCKESVNIVATRKYFRGLYYVVYR